MIMHGSNFCDGTLQPTKSLLPRSDTTGKNRQCSCGKQNTGFKRRLQALQDIQYRLQKFNRQHLRLIQNNNRVTDIM